MEQQANRDVLADLADATGGFFFHNNNDLDEGFRRLAGRPEFSYLLGFSPQNLKLDGKYHKLKVTLATPSAVVQLPSDALDTASGTDTANCTWDRNAARISGRRSVLTMCTGTAAADDASAARSNARTHVKMFRRACAYIATPLEFLWFLRLRCLKRYRSATLCAIHRVVSLRLVISS